MFNQPQSGGGFFDTKNHINSLVLITKVHDVYHNSQNVYQGKPAPRDEAKVDIVDLSQDGVLRERVILTHPGLVNRLSAGASNILGRITQEPTSDGQSHYYALQPYLDQDVELATRWVQMWQAGQLNQPAQTQPQAQPQMPQAQQQQGYGQQPPMGAPQQQPGYMPNGPQASGQDPWATAGQGYNGNPPF